MNDDFALTPPPAIKLSEKHVVRQCLELLRYYHLYPIRLQSGLYIAPDKAVVEALHRAGVKPRYVTIGEPGIPDYVIPQFFIEFKGDGGVVGPDQREKHAELARYDLETLVISRFEQMRDYLTEYQKRQKR